MFFDKKQFTMGGVIEYAAEQWPDRTAIHWKDSRVTFKELNELSDAFAKGLISKGIGKGDRVAVWMHNHPEWVVAWFGISKTGAVLVPLDYWYKENEAGYILKHSGTKALVISEAMLKVDFPKMVDEMRDALPELKTVIVHGEKPGEGFLSWHELLASGETVDDEKLNAMSKDIGMNDIDFILYTSGTTGKPKGASLSHYNVIRNAWDVGSQLKTKKDDNVLVPVPYSHCFGNTLALTMAVLRGAAQTPMLIYDPAKAMEMVGRYGVTMHHGVPTMFNRELDAFRKGDYNLSTLRTGIMAGAPCPYETMKAVLEEMKVNVLIAYGQTEASPVITMTGFGDDMETMTNSVGKPLPGVDVRIKDPETDKVLPVGVQGELCCRGYLVMEGGYFKQPDQTKATIRDGWLHTGDLAVVDEFGYYKITGRAKDMVIVGGFNVFPRNIEEHIIKHPKVQEVAATGVKDHDLGELVAAAIVPSEGQEVTPQEIVDFCYGEMASAAVPRYVAIVDVLPISGRGKVQKFKLQDQLNPMVQAGELEKIVPSQIKKK